MVLLLLSMLFSEPATVKAASLLSTTTICRSTAGRTNCDRTHRETNKPAPKTMAREREKERERKRASKRAMIKIRLIAPEHGDKRPLILSYCNYCNCYHYCTLQSDVK